MSRLISFDIAKAICIVLVAVGHFYPDNSPEWFQQIRTWIYTFHMPLFLFASGYIYNAFRKDEPYSAFILKKVKRLMVPYVVMSFFIISIKLFAQGNLYVENTVTWASYLKTFYKPEAGYFLWFVWTLFSIFLVIPFFKTAMARFVLFVITVFLHYIPFDTTALFAINETKMKTIWFMFGVVCCDAKIQSLLERMGDGVTRCLSVVFIVIFAIVSWNNVSIPSLVNVMPWLGVAAVLSVSYWLSKLQGKMYIKPLMILSVANYVIYLLHTTFEGFCKAVFRKVPALSSNFDLNFCIEATTVILGGVLLPTLLYLFVFNRFAVTRFLFGLPQKKTSG